MENAEYLKLHNYPKITNQKELPCAVPRSQRVFNGHAIFNSNEQFKVIQVRKGHIRKDELTYVLMYKKSTVLLRIDIIGAPHNGIPAPHVHIYDDAHNQGHHAIPLSDIQKYNSTTNIINSLAEFLKYNNFELDNLKIYEPTV